MSQFRACWTRNTSTNQCREARPSRRLSPSGAPPVRCSGTRGEVAATARGAQVLTRQGLRREHGKPKARLETQEGNADGRELRAAWEEWEMVETLEMAMKIMVATLTPKCQKKELMKTQKEE